MHFKTLRDVDVSGKRVLLREDLNVPMKDGAIADETRIQAALPTLRFLHEHGAKTVILSHLGRPDGKPNSKYSLRPLAARLAELLGTDVRFVEDCIGPAAVAASNALPDGGFVLFENVRFHAEEEANDPAFAHELAKSGDLYVNDAFGTAHRAHASTAGVAADLPAYAGFLMEAELAALSRLTNDPARPFVCAIGGAKVVDKVGVFENLLAKVDAFVIGGGMANTFLAAQGIEVGKSLRDPDLVPAQRIIAMSLAQGVALHLPDDAVVADAFDADDTARTVPLDQVGDGMILDIGPRTARAYADVLRRAKTIVFNGPMGVYEKPAYQNGTRVVGEAIAEATKNGAISVIGGGDAAAAAHALGFADAVTHVSTGGGATLEFLEGKTLPGVAALEQSAARS
ncbi:MAG: phosphoglycerate kinase [Candidatus Eremiobacteraeota bacterium]|jgi:phosphoglycerate kinase|nr:phosphoglycerate kinase [Candidatus Eremiobacteraeota bacterium]